MSDDLQSPNLVEKGKNLAKFSWDLINYIQTNHEKVLFVSDEIYEERIKICKSCNQFKELQNECAACGCYLPAKAKIVIDSCPLEKWTAHNDGWDDKFNDIMKDMDK
tara:strand:+ start:125 stop:445 length:321 start_codon:yes stop_codon:yes gene_type:complete